MESSSAVLGLVLLIVSNAVAQVAADFDGDIILGRPTETSMSVSVMTYLDQYVYVEYGDQRGEFGTPGNLSVWANSARKTLCSTGTTICM